MTTLEIQSSAKGSSWTVSTSPSGQSSCRFWVTKMAKTDHESRFNWLGFSELQERQYSPFPILTYMDQQLRWSELHFRLANLLLLKQNVSLASKCISCVCTRYTNRLQYIHLYMYIYIYIQLITSVCMSVSLCMSVCMFYLCILFLIWIIVNAIKLFKLSQHLAMHRCNLQRPY